MRVRPRECHCRVTNKRVTRLCIPHRFYFASIVDKHVKRKYELRAEVNRLNRRLWLVQQRHTETMLRMPTTEREEGL